MRVRTLALQNIRSFVKADLVFSPSINVIIGLNNMGKSTLLLPLLSLQDGLPSLEIGDVRLGAQTARVDITLEDSDPALFQNAPTHLVFRYDKQGQGLSLTMDDGHNYVPINKAKNKEPANFIYPFLSGRKVLRTLNQNVNSSLTEAVPADFSNLNPKIDRVSNPGFVPAYDFFVKACDNVLGFRVTSGHTEQGKRAVYVVRNTESIPLTSMGDGVMNILGLVADLAVADRRLFVIEELENDIHPGALKGLCDLILERAENNQFVVTTHSNIVLKRLGTHPGAKIFEVACSFVERLPESDVCPVPESPESRLELLAKLGYELSDDELWEGWLFLEESSAEKIIREYLIPWFAPVLCGRLRTFSCQSISQVANKVAAFDEIFKFVHLQPVYKNRVWVVVDGGRAEGEELATLAAPYLSKGWRKEQFQQFERHDFEDYYPEPFRSELSPIRAMADRRKKQDAKRHLLAKVEEWIASDSEAAKQLFKKSAEEIIGILREIERLLSEIHSHQPGDTAERLVMA